MRLRILAVSAAVAAVVMVLSGWPGPGPAIAQTPTATADSWTPPQTPWGHPDLQGIWGLGYTFVALERPDDLAGKEFLSDEEVAALEADHQTRTAGDGAGGRCFVSAPRRCASWSLPTNRSGNPPARGRAPGSAPARRR